jgi:hypothetical protein
MMEPPVEMEEEFNEWYDTERIPEREAVHGILWSAQRFAIYEGSPRYLALHDLESIEVLRSESYQRIGIDNLSPRSKRIIRSVQGFKRNVYEQTFPGTANISKEGNTLALWAYDIDAGKEDKLNQYYNTECISHLKKVDRSCNVRRFICTEDFPKHLPLLDFKDVKFFENEAYRKALLFQEAIEFKKYFKEMSYNLRRKHINK